MGFEQFSRHFPVILNSWRNLKAKPQNKNAPNYKIAWFYWCFCAQTITSATRNKQECTEHCRLSGNLLCKAEFFGCRRTRKNIVIWLIFAESQNFFRSKLHFPQNFDFMQDCFHKFKTFPSLWKIAFANYHNLSRIYEEKENICKNWRKNLTFKSFWLSCRLPERE